MLEALSLSLTLAASLPKTASLPSPANVNLVAQSTAPKLHFFNFSLSPDGSDFANVSGQMMNISGKQITVNLVKLQLNKGGVAVKSVVASPYIVMQPGQIATIEQLLVRNDSLKQSLAGVQVKVISFTDQDGYSEAIVQ